MKTTTVIEQSYTHSFPKGRIDAKTRNNKLVEFSCYGTGSLSHELTSHYLITFLMENWDEVKEVWEAIRQEILD